ncbi:MAG: sigma-70 family RNA polymerase sigma factor [Oscillospiraceae bacterium]|nr:sigma-70 family RNA polymerase sigma factor [Oscillospiraceae bacterium]
MERNEAVLSEEDKEAIVRQFMSFCLTAIRFECYDFYREQRRQSKKDRSLFKLRRPPRSYLCSGFEVEEHFLYAAGQGIPVRSLSIFEGLLALEPRQREVLLQHFWMGMSRREVTEELGCSVSTVCRVLNRALREMEKRLDRWERQNGKAYI